MSSPSGVRTVKMRRSKKSGRFRYVAIATSSGRGGSSGFDSARTAFRKSLASAICSSVSVRMSIASMTMSSTGIEVVLHLVDLDLPIHFFVERLEAERLVDAQPGFVRVRVLRSDVFDRRMLIQDALHVCRR